MKKQFKIVIFIVLVIALLILFTSLNKQKEQTIKQVCFKDSCFNVEIADNESSREKGLMYVESLPQNDGMLFIFETEDIYSFWMKNTLIPLDMIWLDSSRKIVYIQNNALPCKEVICKTYTPTGKAKYVLEINAGKASELNLKQGENADFSY